jgi:hypothetical protein
MIYLHCSFMGATTQVFGHPSHQKLSPSTQMDGQMEQVNQIIKDMLRACVLTDDPKWGKHLPLAEFSYNNSYQESIKMSPFESLYG